jgi:membrane dipeptidase
MVASHTVCDALNHHIRAKPVDVIKAICDTGGLVGICCISPFLGGEGGIAALLDHIGYVVERFGVDHVAIGSDVGYSSQNEAVEAAKVTAKRGARRGRYEAFWPEGALGKKFPGTPQIAWTNWPMFTVGLVQRGYKDADIQKILGLNMLRVCRENYSVKAG